MIIIQPTGGLCNYLRVIFSYYEYAKSIDSELTVIWNITEECNGYFLDFFEPIPNITFLTTMPLNANIYYKGYSVHPNFSPNYNYLKLLPFMKELVISRQNLIGNNYISLHIRRTDHINLAIKNNNYTTDDTFINFIDKYENKNIYIATDNEETYNNYKQKYKNKIKIEYHKTNSNSLRHTSLQDAILDIYMCVFSEHFMGSGWSSFSGVIIKLRQIQKM